MTVSFVETHVVDAASCTCHKLAEDDMHEIIEAIDGAELDVPQTPITFSPDLEIRSCAKAIVESQDGSKIQDFHLTTRERGKVIELLEEVGVGKALVIEVVGLA